MKQEIIADVQVQGLASLDKLNKELSDLKKTADKAAQEVDSLKDELKKVDKVAKKAGPELEDVAGMFSKMGGAGGAAGAKLEGLAVMMKGPLGAAIAGSMVAVGGLMLAFKGAQLAVDVTLTSIKAYIDETPVLKEASDRASDALDRVKVAFGEAAVGGKNFKKTLDVVATEFDKLTADIQKDATEINDVFKAVMTIAAWGSKMILSWLALVAEWFVIVPDLVMTTWSGIRKSILVSYQGLLDLLGPMLVFLNRMTQEQVDRHKAEVAATLKNQKGFFFEYSQMVLVATNRVSGFIDKVHEAFQATEKAPKATRTPLGVEEGAAPGDSPLTLRGPSDPATVIKGGKGKPKGAGKGAGAGKASGLVSGVPPGLMELSDYEKSAQALRESLEGLQEDLDSPALAATNEQLKETAKWLAEGGAMAEYTASVWSGVLFESLVMVKDGLIDMTAHIAQTMGAFQAGVGTLSEFGDSILDMFGGLANQIGMFFIKTGIGLAFISPLQGAGMIAAGIALNALGGWMGAKGSGNAGTGGGGASAGTESTITREIQRSLRGPDQGGSSTTIEVVIAGRAIEPEMVSIIDDISRLRRSRQIGRMRA